MSMEEGLRRRWDGGGGYTVGGWRIIKYETTILECLEQKKIGCNVMNEYDIEYFKVFSYINK